MTDYTKLVTALQNNDWSDACPCCDEAMCKDADCIILQAADAIEDLDGFLSEAERDRDEYEERMRKEQERVIVLQAEVKRLQDKLCDWCAVCPKEHRKPEDCELLSETPVMYGPSGAKMTEVQDDKTGV